MVTGLPRLLENYNMFQIIQFLLTVCFFFVVAQCANPESSWSSNDAYQSLYLSCDAFCDPAGYLGTKNYNGVIQGFNATMTIHEKKYDTYGFVGYLPSAASIYVTYRGSEGWQNWMADLETTKVTYPYCSGCEVHKGFYEALMGDFDNVEKEVRRLKSLFPNYTVKTTGHSLGAALAQLASMELVARGIAVKYAYTFGQPRTGNAAYSSYTSAKVPLTYRHVHYADPVPHVPPPEFGFYHNCLEEWEPNEVYHASQSGALLQCGSFPDNCEDTGGCMETIPDKNLNPDDHMIYLGVPIKCYA